MKRTVWYTIIGFILIWGVLLASLLKVGMGERKKSEGLDRDAHWSKPDSTIEGTPFTNFML